jgi:hypothetical protein
LQFGNDIADVIAHGFWTEIKALSTEGVAAMPSDQLEDDSDAVVLNNQF